MKIISVITEQCSVRIDTSVQKGITWFRESKAQGTIGKIQAYVAAFFVSLALLASLIGIPLLYKGLKEYGKQETQANGIEHPILASIQSVERSWVFFRRFIQDPAQVSSIIPSSSALTSEMASKVHAEPQDLPRRYLEVGAGSGAITVKILENMRKGVDHLDIVEIDPEFCELLRDLVKDWPNVRVHQASITDFDPGVQYDAILSGLPVHGLPSAIVEGAFAKYQELAGPGSTVSQFEYHPVLREIKKKFLSEESLEDFERVLEIKQQFIDANKMEVVKVYANFPPAQVLHFSMRGEGEI